MAKKYPVYFKHKYNSTILTDISSNRAQQKLKEYLGVLLVERNKQKEYEYP